MDKLHHNLSVEFLPVLRSDSEVFRRTLNIYQGSDDKYLVYWKDFRSLWAETDMNKSWHFEFDGGPLRGVLSL